MELQELKESVRRNMAENNIQLLDVIATGHNLIKCIENRDRQRLAKKTVGFLQSYNNLIVELNKTKTPIEDKIIEFENKIENLKSQSRT